MAYWLLKTEPSAYGFGDLEAAGQTRWDGVSNPVALKNLGAARVGDGIVVYHTGDERAAVGTAEVVREAYPDPKDGKSPVIDIRAGARLASPVGLATLKAQPAFADSPLVRQGRLSVVPLSAAQWALIGKLGAAR